MKNTSHCDVCNNRKKTRKRKPYGLKKGVFWCSSCDKNKVSTVSKKRERRKSKLYIKKEIDSV